MLRQILGPSLESALPLTYSHPTSPDLLLIMLQNSTLASIALQKCFPFYLFLAPPFPLIALSHFTLHCSFHRLVTQMGFVYSSLSPLDFELLKGRNYILNFCLLKTQSSTFRIVVSQQYSLNEWMNEWMSLLSIKRELDIISTKLNWVCMHKRIASLSQMWRTRKKNEINNKSVQRHGRKLSGTGRDRKKEWWVGIKK